jgi:hypothetical protein
VRTRAPYTFSVLLLACLLLSSAVFAQSTFTIVPPPYQAVPPGPSWQSQYSPWVMHLPGWGSWVMYYCKNSSLNGVMHDRVWRTESWTGGANNFINDAVVIDGTIGTEDEASCSPGVVISANGTWHMYYVTSPANSADTYIHHATAPSPGLTWTKVGRVGGIPQPAPNDGFETPSPILENGQIVLYYIWNGHLEKASSTDGQNFTNIQTVGSVNFISHGHVTYDPPWFYFVYSTDPTHNNLPPTEIRFSGPVSNSDAFASGNLLLQPTVGTFYSKYVWSPQLLLGSDGQPPRVYFAGNTSDYLWWGGNGSIGAASGILRHLVAP